ncbi:MAG: LytTR family DNA-binding domain-containing protein [Oscillospiraceae bacterium]|nr:LytTR family DNA-binding domain-containing protein [Oscillospiraceae bacterium]
MVLIAICDDEIQIGAELERALIEIFTQRKIKYEIDVFFTGADLCKKMEAGAHYDLIFLDIAFAKGERNGVEVGRLIREVHQNHLSAIVYISWETKYALDLFEIQPLNFLRKPLEHGKIEEVIRTYLKIAGLWTGEFIYKKGHDTFKLQIKDIIYLESRDRKLILHLADGRKEECYGSLKEAYNEQLRRFDFLYIHAAYVVNYDYVTAVKYNQLLISGSETPLPISPNRRGEVRNLYLEIMKRRV